MTDERVVHPRGEACLSVVMPCYNEAETVGQVVSAVLASPYTREIIAVDDGSTDRTLDVLRSISDPRLVVIHVPVNEGKGAALRRGFARARGPLVIVQDADLEYDPGEYGAVLAPLLQDKADVVYGSRFHTAKPHRVLYFWHSVGNKFLTTVSNMSTNLNLTDVETCYKAFRREVLDSLEIKEDRFGFEAEVTAKVAGGRWRIYEVGVSYSGRTYAQGKKIGWRDGVKALYCILRYSPFWTALRERGAVTRAVFDDRRRRPGRLGSVAPLDARTDDVDRSRHLGIQEGEVGVAGHSGGS